MTYLGDSNAFTADDKTVYYLSLANEGLKEAMELRGHKRAVDGCTSVVGEWAQHYIPANPPTNS